MGGGIISVTANKNTTSSAKNVSIGISQTGGKSYNIPISQKGKIVNLITVDQSDDPIDDMESTYSIYAYSQYPLQSNISISLSIKLGKTIERTFVLSKGQSDFPDLWESIDSIDETFMVSLDSYSPDNDDSYIYQVETPY